jgi:putative zinc finger/helix-turn-helix YgiT family protein
MKSPITSKEMILSKEMRTVNFRKSDYYIVYNFYKCEDSGEQFTTTALDELNSNQLYNQYRTRYNIPFPEEIKRIREQYGVSLKSMSQILGFGINSYRQYENGEMPSVSNARLINLADNPSNFIEMIENTKDLDVNTRNKYIIRLMHILESNAPEYNIEDYLAGKLSPNIFTGYRNPNFAKFAEMIVFFSQKVEPFKTKMNKLLFFADFLMFKNTSFSISGIRYEAISKGPVPYRFQSIYEYLANNEIIDIIYTEFPAGYSGEQFKSKSNRPFNSSLFSEYELQVLDRVAEEFKDTSTSEIVEKSHLENGWKENEKKKDLISYNFAFELTQI